MFCDKCGSSLPSGAKFCAKCGSTVIMASKKENENILVKKLSEIEVPKLAEVKIPKKLENVSFNNFRKPLIIGAGAVILLLVLIIGIRLGHSKQKSDTMAASNQEEQTIGSSYQEEQDIETEEITTSSAITLKGNYANLKSVIMLGTADSAVPAINYHEGSAFPKLENLQCGAVMKTLNSGETGYFNEADFPALKSVKMRLVNKYIDEDTLMTYLLFYEMYQSGRLQKFDMQLVHTIEDLYGTWTDAHQTLSFTFSSDGTLRIAGFSDFLGADIMKYKEVNDNTLSLSADTSSLLDIVSINMNYEIFGDTLQVELAGQQFELNKKN